MKTEFRHQYPSIIIIIRFILVLTKGKSKYFKFKVARSQNP